MDSCHDSCHSYHDKSWSTMDKPWINHDKPELLGDDSCHWNPPFFPGHTCGAVREQAMGCRSAWKTKRRGLGVFSTSQDTGLWTWGKRWMMSFFLCLTWVFGDISGMISSWRDDFYIFCNDLSFFEIRGMEGGNFQLGSSGSIRSKNTLNPNLFLLLLLNHGRTLPNAGKHSVGTGYPHLHFILLVG